MTRTEVAADDIEAIHGIVTEGFTDRYLHKLGLDKFGLAHSAPYDPTDPLCDYERTYWPANPNRLSQRYGNLILSQNHGISPREIEDIVVQPFMAQAPKITKALGEFPVMLINGHEPDLQAAMSIFAGNIAMARTLPGSTKQNYNNMVKRSHGFVARGFLPIVIGPKWGPFLNRRAFVNVMQRGAASHFTFPVTRQMIESGMPREFVKRYNERLKYGAIEIAHGDTYDDPDGLFTFWSMSPGGTRDERPVEGEHAGKTITQRVIPATNELISTMNVGLLPFYSKFGLGKSKTEVEVGEIIPPDEVTPETVPGIMVDLAEFRRKHGEANVVYEGELAA